MKTIHRGHFIPVQLVTTSSVKGLSAVIQHSNVTYKDHKGKISLLFFRNWERPILLVLILRLELLVHGQQIVSHGSVVHG